MNAGDPLPPLRAESELPPEEQTFRRNINRVLAKGREVTRKGFAIRWPHAHREDHRCQIINKDTKQVVGEGNNPDANTALVQAAKDYARRQAACFTNVAASPGVSTLVPPPCKRHAETDALAQPNADH